MRIGIHTNSIDDRGCGRVIYDYGHALRKFYNYEVFLYSSSKLPNESIDRYRKEFPIKQYDVRIGTPENNKLISSELNRLIEEDKLDFMHLIKSGDIDGVLPDACKTGVHCVFNMSQPHGSVYAGVSDYIAKKYNKTAYIPHIIKPLSPTEDIRNRYNIPKDALVIGRHGGRDTFSLPFVKQAVIDTVTKHRKDVWFLFLSTAPFIENERVIYLPWAKDDQAVYNFIHACDIMIHGRAEGETFGLAIAEFSACNKPVITWSGKQYPQYDKAHIDLLGKKAIIYSDYSELINTLYSIQRSDIKKRDWDVYSERFSDQNVIKQYRDVFLT